MLYQPRVNRKSGSRFLVTTYKFPIGRKLETGSPKPGTVIVALLFLAATLSACVVPAPAPSRRAPSQRDDYSSAPPPPSRRLDSADAERLRRVMIPLLQAMDHPCRADQVRVGIINQNEINAANAGNCEFYITAGLLRAPTTINCAVCWRMRSPTKISATWRKHRCLVRDSIFLSAGLQQLFPAAGVLAPIAGELVARGYGRTEEYAADRHGVDILRRAGYSKDTMLDALTWIRRVSGSAGGGFLSTHPGLDERIATIEKMR